MVLFDLPTETKKDRKNYTEFRKKMMKDGFTMFQFSAYLRHCASRENAEVHLNRVQKSLPPKGNVGILTITDKQFGMMQIFYGKEEKESLRYPNSLSFFERETHNFTNRKWFIFTKKFTMATFTSTLPDDLLQLLTEKAKALSLPKNRLMENALRLYLEHIEKAEYIKSYKLASTDENILLMAEEGMANYLKQLEK